MRRYTSFLASVAAILLSAAVASAQPQGGPGGMGRRGAGGPGGPGRQGPPLDIILQLTPQQQAALKTLNEQEREATRPLFEQQRPLHESLRDMLESDNPDAATVGRQVLAVVALQKQIKAVHDSYHEKLVALLTPDQAKKLEQLEARMGPGGPGRGMGMPFLGPPPPKQ